MEHYLREAIKTRESRRAYQRLPLRKQDSDAIQSLIKRFNAEAGLRLALIEIDEELFRKYRYGLSVYKNVVNYIALCGNSADPDLEDRLGYYGELLVLEAEAMGLNTCWITKTYDKQLCESRLDLEDGEKLAGIIAIGYARERRALREIIKKRLSRPSRKRRAQILLADEGGVPDWVEDGIECVLLAPTAAGHPVEFRYREGLVHARLTRSGRGLELGISLVHFEIGSAAGRWLKQSGSWVFASTQPQARRG